MSALSKLPLRTALASFAVTHCRNCAAGWTREGQNGATRTVCLLDREPVWAGMTDCDRYEPRQDC